MEKGKPRQNWEDAEAFRGVGGAAYETPFTCTYQYSIYHNYFGHIIFEGGYYLRSPEPIPLPLFILNFTPKMCLLKHKGY